MDNTSNLGSFRSVYMAYGAFKVEPAGSGTKTASQVKTDGSEVPAFLTALNLATEKTAGEATSSENGEFWSKNALDGNYSQAPKVLKNGDLAESSGKAQNLKEAPFRGGAYLSYTRIITANIPADIASQMKNGTEGTAFDYSGGGQELKITISVSGDSRIYTATGTDKDGNAFSKEIDPYNVDPTDTDYAGFATLCAYIRDTEGMADNAMQAVKDAAPADITENGNYLVKVGYVSMSNGNFSGAKKLFEQMQKFFEKLIDISADNNVKSVTDNNVNSVSSENSVNNYAKLINMTSASSGRSSGLSDGSYGRIFDELQQMIQTMMQQMLNEIIGVDRLGETDESGKESIEESLHLENAKEL